VDGILLVVPHCYHCDVGAQLRDNLRIQFHIFNSGARLELNSSHTFNDPVSNWFSIWNNSFIHIWETRFVATLFLTFVRTIDFRKSSESTIPVSQFLKLLPETSTTGEQAFLFRAGSDSFGIGTSSSQRSSMLDTTEPFVWDPVASSQ
jgi:hypothetical protein